MEQIAFAYVEKCVSVVRLQRLEEALVRQEKADVNFLIFLAQKGLERFEVQSVCRLASFNQRS